MASDAVARRGSFNVIHLATMFKIDLFVLGADGLSREELSRRRRYRVGDEQTEVFVASPEDIVLQKLRWYRKGHEISDRQWRDVVEVLRTQGSLLDREYVDRWARELGVDDLLQEAVADADML